MPEPISRRRLLLLGPAAAAAAGGMAFWAMLKRMKDGSFDPHGIPNPLVGQTVPDFTLPGFTSADLREAAQAGPVLLNFFASWCQPCLVEAPVLADAKAALPIWGIAYKDKPADTAAYLRRTGSPYAKLAADEPGRIAIDWGVTGVPETFLIDRAGRIAWHWSGPLSPDQLPGLRRMAG